MFFLHVVKMCHTKSIGTLTWIGIWHCRKMFKMLSVVPLCQAALKFGTSGTYVYVFWAGTPSSSGVVSLSLWPQFWCSLPMDCATSQWWTTCKWDMNTIMIKYVRAVVSIYIFSTTTWFDLKLRTKKVQSVCVCAFCWKNAGKKDQIPELSLLEDDNDGRTASYETSRPFVVDVCFTFGSNHQILEFQ